MIILAVPLNERVCRFSYLWIHMKDLVCLFLRFGPLLLIK